MDAAVAAVERDLPPVAALVNNAGITAPTRFLDIDVDEWDRIFDVNVAARTSSRAGSCPGCSTAATRAS